MPRSKLVQAAGLTVAIYWVLMFVGTHVPIWGSPGATLSKLGEGSDKAAHCLAFAGLAFLLCTVASLRWGFRQSFFAAVVGLLLAYSAIDEWTQGFVPTRETSSEDWCADMLGVGLGLSAFSLVCEPLLRRVPRTSPSDDSRAVC